VDPKNEDLETLENAPATVFRVPDPPDLQHDKNSRGACEQTQAEAVTVMLPVTIAQKKPEAATD